MSPRPPILATLLLCLLAQVASAADDYIEHLQDFLTVSAFQSQFRVRLSGLVDLEYYHVAQPPPGLIYTTAHDLFNPRLSLFLDGQLGGHLYFFIQSRVDRGFDPDDGGSQIRVDEYALRLTPWDDGRLSVQLGKFASVQGNWNQRHLSWDNPFVTAPLPYENLTGMWDSSAPGNAATLLSWAYVPYHGTREFAHGTDKPLRLPIVWGPSYATGLSLAGRLGKVDYAAEVKNTSLSSRPEQWDLTARDFSYPTFTGRLGFRPNEAWNLGLSASSGAYLDPAQATVTLPPGHSLGDYHQQVLAQDLSYEWHHLQLWAEVYEARFQVPEIGNADTLAYYLEAKYKLTPQLFGALRWNHQLYSTIRDGEEGRVPWGNDLWRIDAALGYRFTPHTQLKLQGSLQHEENAPSDLTTLVATQFTLRF